MNKVGAQGVNSLYKNYNINKEANKKNNNSKSSEKQSYVEFSKNEEVNNKYTYTHLNEKNIKKIDVLKSEMDESYESLKKLINDLILKQNSVNKKIKIPGKVAKDAQEAIGENGRFSPEKLSDKIVDFAKNISGGDKSKFEKLRSSIIKGFEEAKKILGGNLPEISKKTYDLVMEKLDNWKSE